MKSVALTTKLFKTKQCPRYAKYAFACAYDGLLYFSDMHPDILLAPGIEFGWIPRDNSKYKKCDVRIKSDYVERLVLCRNGNDFEPHEKEIERMRQIDEMLE